MGRYTEIELDEVQLDGPRIRLRAWRSSDLGQRSQAAGTGLEVAVVRLDDDVLLGSAAISLPQSGGGSADVGYWIAPHAQGHGYAAEATQVLADWALQTGLVRRVEVRCEPANLASARTALRAGHAFESYRR